MSLVHGSLARIACQFTVRPLYYMRDIIPIVFVAAAALAGCHSPSAVYTQSASPSMAATPPFRQMLITNFCTQTSPDGTWRIGASEDSVEVSRFSGLTGEGFPGRTKDSPDGVTIPWTARAGWFAFTENANRVWAYDGNRLLILETCSDASWNRQHWISGGCASYFGHYPCAIPAEVFSRLSAEARKDVRRDE